MQRYLCSLVALGLLVGVSGQAMAQPSYSFTILDVPGSCKASAIALGINASGQIVGEYYDTAYLHHCFLLDQGRYPDLHGSGSAGTFATGINASGQIVGYYFAGTKGHGFLLDLDGCYTTLDVPGANYTYALGINASGQI